MKLCNGFTSNSTLDKSAAPGYIRFEPITVRAAVRVIQLKRAGVISSVEADFYVSELAAMDRHTGAKSAAALARLARRQARPERVSRPCEIEDSMVWQLEQRLAIAA